MGDRANVFFVDRQKGKRFEGMYMYMHHDGSYLPGIVRDALKRGSDSWGDSEYLARIVFCEMIKDSVLDDHGYGIGTELTDNEHKIIRINDLDERVSFHIPGKERSPADKGTASWGYEEFVKTKDAVLNEAFIDPPDDEDQEERVASPATKSSTKKKSTNKKSATKKSATKKSTTQKPPKTRSVRHG